MNLNKSSLLPKIDKLSEIARIPNPAVVGITETKIDNSIGDSEISIDGYSAIQRDRNRKGGGVLSNSLNVFNMLVKDDIFQGT